MRITEDQLSTLVARLDREGHQLTVRTLVRIHELIDDCLMDGRAEGTQHELLDLVRERMHREP